MVFGIAKIVRKIHTERFVRKYEQNGFEKKIYLSLSFSALWSGRE